MAAVLFLFLDGVGLGPADSLTNPFAAAETPFLAGLLGERLTDRTADRGAGEAVVRRLDATLGHPGLPQSATGQGTLLTGWNCADVMSGHYGPWPGPTLKRVLDQGTVFSDTVAAGGRALLANAYPPGYFGALERGRARENVPVHAARSAGLTLPDLERYRLGEGLAADLTGEHFASVDSRLPSYSPEEAGGLLSRLAAVRSFTFFDFWLSDRIGHRGSFEEAVALVETLDRFIAGVVGELAGTVTLLVTSDHGNLEDKTVRGHTRAPVPLLALGPQRSAFADCSSLMDVAPALRRVLLA